jgi:hypothetical protein
MNPITQITCIEVKIKDKVSIRNQIFRLKLSMYFNQLRSHTSTVGVDLEKATD